MVDFYESHRKNGQNRESANKVLDHCALGVVQNKKGHACTIVIFVFGKREATPQKFLDEPLG
jgi:hypothetical protein